MDNDNPVNRPEMNKRVTEEQMLASLQRAFAGDEEQSLMRRLRRKLEDPLQPVGDEDGKGRRLHPVLVSLLLLFLISLGTFIYFGITQT
jgi:hypothetical protein